MKSIDTLVDDIRDVLANPGDYDFLRGEVNAETLGKKLADTIVSKLTYEPKPKLRMSNYGTPDRKLWYQVNQPENSEPLSAEARLKFLYGDIIEELVLFLAQVAGHKVEGQQDEQEVTGVIGHRDCVIDGQVVDVKSSSSFGFFKFKNHELEKNDPFHYLDQLNLYVTSAKDDPVVTDKEHGSFLAIDKQFGKICLDTYDRKEVDYEAETKRKQNMLEEKEPPKKCYFPVPDGKSGNMKLDTACSYCSFKNTCYPELRTFLYANGPRFLTTVEKTPDVPEVKK